MSGYRWIDLRSDFTAGVEIIMDITNSIQEAIIGKYKYKDRKDFPNDALIHFVARYGTVEEMELLSNCPEIGYN